MTEKPTMTSVASRNGLLATTSPRSEVAVVAGARSNAAAIAPESVTSSECWSYSGPHTLEGSASMGPYITIVY
jgi:hypothetical protein